MFKLLYTTFSDTYDCRRFELARGMAVSNSSYKGLAQKNSVVNRKVVAAQLPRLSSVCENVEPVNVEMEFRFDDHDRICVNAKTETLVHLECHLCSEQVAWPMQVDFDAIMAASEEQAEEWSVVAAEGSAGAENIIVASGHELDVAELIEDELILQLPRQVCFDESCIHKPVMQFYEAGVESQSDLPADRQLPFQGLKELVERNGLAQGDGSEE